MNTRVDSTIVKLLKEKDEIFDVTSTLDYPTIADVLMWLYEKHKIWIIVSHEISCSHQTEWFWIGVHNGEEIAYQYFGFKSPIEAYSQAIEYTLKNLI